MNLYLIKRTDDTSKDWDIYLGAVVAAPSVEIARSVHPDGYGGKVENLGTYDAWFGVVPDHIEVTLIGTATPDVVAGVVISSFKAG